MLSASTEDPLLKYSFFPDSNNLYLQHLHEILGTFIFYTILNNYIAPRINRLVFNKSYTLSDKKTKLDFDTHIVSTVQALVAIYISIPPLFIPLNTYKITEYQDDRCSMVAALTSGYFFWDLSVCIQNYDLYGPVFSAHAISSLLVFFSSLRPFGQAWTGRFLIYEASTPFVNVNWFIITLTKLKQPVSTLLNVVNGVSLLVVFFLVRIVWGNIANVLVFKEMWDVRHEGPMLLMLLMVVLNQTLSILNLVWFRKMVIIAKKMATRASQGKKQE